MYADNTPDHLAASRERWLGKLVEDGPSPAGNWLGLTLVDAEPGEITLSLYLKKDMTNPYGNIHGGMMALIMDEAIGWSVVSLGAPTHYTTMNLVVDFLYAAAEGETLTAKSKVIRQGKKVVHAVCDVFDSKGTLLAKGSSNLIVTGMQPKAG